MIARLLRSALLALAVTGLTACAAEEAPEPKKPDDFAQVLAVAPQNDGRLGRVVLPAAAVAEIKRPDLGDVRIFDAKGRTLSLALGYDRSGESSLLKTQDLPAIPIAATQGGAAVPIAAVNLKMAGSDGIVPLQLFGRNDRSEPWGLLASGTLKQGDKPLSLELSGATLREYRLVADPRSAGFSKEPEVSLTVEPITIFAAFNGQGPFNLAVGHQGAKPAWFDPADLGTASDLLRAWRQSAEVASAGDAPVILLAPAAPETPFDPRKLALWGALLLGTALLAFAAFRLMRANAAKPSPPGDSSAD